MLPCVAPAARQYCLHAVMGWLSYLLFFKSYIDKCLRSLGFISVAMFSKRVSRDSLEKRLLPNCGTEAKMISLNAG
jgi:hypothetical protein